MINTVHLVAQQFYSKQKNWELYTQDAYITQLSS